MRPVLAADMRYTQENSHGDACTGIHPYEPSYNGSPENSNRIKDILKKFIIPSILQIFQSIAVLYPEADMDILQKIVERGMKDADIS